MTTVVVLVPRRADGDIRDAHWAWILEHYWAGWAVHEGTHDDGPFNRAAAINEAARAAGTWDVAVIADADSFVGADQLALTIDRTARTGQMGLAYDRFCYLSRPMTDAIVAGYQGSWEPGVEWTLPGTCSSMVVVRHDVWDAADGFDEGFESWGMEDVAFSHAAQTFGCGLHRASGPVWHLWHPPSGERHAHPFPAKVARAERYRDAAYDPPAMRALLDELRLPR